VPRGRFLIEIRDDRLVASLSDSGEEFVGPLEPAA
jgi:hypothetical protein